MKDQNTPLGSSGSSLLLLVNAYTAGAGLSPAVIEAGMRRGRRERAQMAATVFGALFRGLRAAVTGLVRGIQGAQQRRAARIALYRLDQHLLDDLGIPRERISQVVDGVLSRPEAGAAGAVPTADAARARVSAEVQHRMAA